MQLVQSHNVIFDEESVLPGNFKISSLIIEVTAHVSSPPSQFLLSFHRVDIDLMAERRILDAYLNGALEGELMHAGLTNDVKVIL